MPAIKTRTAPALYHSLNILDLLTNSRAGLTLPDLVERSSLAKSSVHYLLVTLERCGYVYRVERTGRYVLGLKLFSMADSALRLLSLRDRTASYLSALKMRTGLTVHLAILERGEAVLVAKQETPGGAPLASWIGKRMEMHCTAIGKAILAYLPQVEVDAIIHNHGLARHNENTISSPRRLHEELERVVKIGYALDNEEDELGVVCIGLPIFGPAGRPVAAISLAGSTHEVTLEDLSCFSGELQQTARMMGRPVTEFMVFPSLAGALVSATS
jgi:DNA-binding IclR family transcriptional regulator